MRLLPVKGPITDTEAAVSGAERTGADGFGPGCETTSTLMRPMTTRGPRLSGTGDSPAGNTGSAYCAGGIARGDGSSRGKPASVTRRERGPEGSAPIVRGGAGAMPGVREAGIAALPIGEPALVAFDDCPSLAAGALIGPITRAAGATRGAGKGTAGAALPAVPLSLFLRSVPGPLVSTVTTGAVGAGGIPAAGAIGSAVAASTDARGPRGRPSNPAIPSR